MQENLQEKLKESLPYFFHFNLIVGSYEKLKEDFWKFLKEDFNFSDEDIFFEIKPEEGKDSISMNQIRELEKKTIIKSKSFKKIFIIHTDKFPYDVQNASLKTFEDGGENNFYFLFLPTLSGVLDTILSRANIIDFSKDFYFPEKEIEIFLENNFSQREKKIKEILDEKKSIFFVKDLEKKILEKQVEALKKNKFFIEDFENFYKKFLILKKYLGNKGASSKNILEFLAVNTPKI